MKPCAFCSNPSFADLMTIYGTHICSTCHDVLVRRGISRSVEEITSEKEEWERQHIEREKKSFLFSGGDTSGSRQLISKTQTTIENRGTITGYLAFAMVLIGLWFYGSLLTIAIVVVAGAVIFALRAYTHEQLANTQGIIDSEIQAIRQEWGVEREKRLLAWEQVRDAVEAKVKRKSGRLFSRHIRIMATAKKEGILLWEYYRRDYPEDWEKRAEIVKQRDGYCCQRCGANQSLHVHHKERVKAGGTHHLSNLVTLCGKCHSEEHQSHINQKQQAKGTNTV